MRSKVLFLIAIILLFLIPSFVLQGVYGPSYGFLAGEDYWQPDGSGGWIQHGQPASPPPAQPSVDVPIWARYIPILLPGLVLFLFLFTPLSRRLEGPLPPKEPSEQPDDEAPPRDSGP